jgi:hypothetical protein
VFYLLLLVLALLLMLVVVVVVLVVLSRLRVIRQEDMSAIASSRVIIYTHIYTI